jgi:hypothetical protein
MSRILAGIPAPIDAEISLESVRDSLSLALSHFYEKNESVETLSRDPLSVNKFSSHGDATNSTNITYARTKANR